MKKMRKYLKIAGLVSAILAGALSRELCAADFGGNAAPVARDSETKAAIKSYEGRIAEEREAIIADMRRLQEAKRTRDKATIAQVKQEVDQDIAKRKAMIKGLYNDMAKRAGHGTEFEERRRRMKR